jgi:hypothetical protein
VVQSLAYFLCNGSAVDFRGRHVRRGDCQTSKRPFQYAGGGQSGEARGA